MSCIIPLIYKYNLICYATESAEKQTNKQGQQQQLLQQVKFILDSSADPSSICINIASCKEISLACSLSHSHSLFFLAPVDMVLFSILHVDTIKPR